MLRRLLDIRPGEGRVVASLGAYGFFSLAALSAHGSASKALFLETYDADRLPLAYMAGALAGILGATARSMADRRLKARQLSVAATLALVSVLVLLRLGLATPWQIMPFVVFALGPAFGAVLGAEAGTLSRSALDSRSGRRLLPAIGALGGLGAATGSYMVGFLSGPLGTAEMLSFAAGLLLLNLIPRFTIRLQYRPRVKVPPAPWSKIVKHRYAMMLLVAVAVATVLKIVADYQLGASTKELLTADQMGRFYGMFYGSLDVAAILFTLLVSRLLIGKLGIGSSLLGYPLVVGVTGAAVIVAPSLATSASIAFGERLLRQNLQSPVLSIGLMPLPERIRSRVVAAFSGFARPLATALTSVSLLLLASRIHWSSLAWGLVALSLVALAVALVARRDYVRELLSALHARRLRLPDDVERQGSLDARVRALLHKQIASESHERAALALQLIKGYCNPDTLEVIRRQWHLWDGWVKGDAVQALAEEGFAASRTFLSTLSPDEPSEVWVALLRRPGVALPSETVDRLIAAKDAGVRAEALLRRIGERGLDEESRSTLEEWLAADEPRQLRAAARVLGEIDVPGLEDRLAGLAVAAPREVLAAVARRPDQAMASLCVELLASDRTFAAARRAVLAIGAGALDALLAAARDPDRSAQALLVLGEIDDPEARLALLDLLEDANEEMRFRAARALVSGDRPAASEIDILRGAVEREIASCLRYHFERRTRSGALQVEAAGELERAVERVMLLLSVLEPEKAYRKVFLSLVSREPAHRSFALEALDEMLAPEWKQRLLPLLEEEEGGTAPDAADIDPWWLRLCAAIEGSEPDTVIATAVDLKAAPLFASWRLRDLEPLAVAAERADEPYLLVRDGEAVDVAATLLRGASPPRSADAIAVPLAAIYRTIARRPSCSSAWLRGLADLAGGARTERTDVTRTNMLSLASKTVASDHDQSDDLDLWQRIFFLRTLDLARGLSTERLRLLAEIARPVSASPGELIVREGRHGHHFYMVCTGTVEVSSEGQTLSRLGPSDAFGAMALLTGQGRTSTVKALEPCDLLSIERIDFLDLIDTHPALTRAFTQMIVRMREAEA